MTEMPDFDTTYCRAVANMIEDAVHLLIHAGYWTPEGSYTMGCINGRLATFRIHGLFHQDRNKVHKYECGRFSISFSRYEAELKCDGIDRLVFSRHDTLSAVYSTMGTWIDAFLRRGNCG